MVTWAQRLGKDGWYVRKTRDGIDGSRWDAAERSILCPRADMKVAFKFLNGVAIDTYLAKAKGGPNCFDHMIASVSIMPSTIRVAESVMPKLSDHAALVAEWAAGRPSQSLTHVMQSLVLQRNGSRKTYFRTDSLNRSLV